MADISKITLPSGTTYNIKDNQARSDIEDIRESIAGGVTFLGVTTTVLTDGASTNPIVIDGNSKTAANGDIAIYDTEEFIFSSSDSKWHRLGPAGEFKALAYKDSASGDYTPVGSISQPTFTGSSSTVSITSSANANGNYQPAGTISTPTFSGNTMESTGTYTPAGSVTVSTATTENKTATVSKTTGTATYTPEGTVTAPSITVTPTTTTIQPIDSVGSLPAWSGTVTNETLSFSWNAGSLPTKSDGQTVVTGISNATATQPVFTGTGARLVTGNIAVPKTYTGSFSGTEGSVTVSGTPAGTVSQPTFTGAKVQLSGTTTAAGTVSKPTFTGTQATITVS